MSFISKEKKTIDSCRFCWMCRHICPVGNQTAKEINTSRGRGLVLSSVLRGKEFNAEVAEAVYECALCGACIQQCETGWDPTAFTRAARADAISEALQPEPVKCVIDKLDRYGNPFGLPEENRMKDIRKDVGGLPEKAEILLFIGCTAAYKANSIAGAAINLLKKAGVNFTVLKEEECCGLYMSDLIGGMDDARRQAVGLAEKIRATGAKTLVAICPSCTKAFKREYKEWGIELGMDILTITSYMAQLVNEEKLKPGTVGRKVTFHDPCRLARDLEETKPAREILEKINVDFKEMYFNGAVTHCCGSGLLNEYAPKLTDKTSAGRWKEAVSTDADTLVVACPSCKDVMSKTRPEAMALEDLLELLWEACSK